MCVCTRACVCRVHARVRCVRACIVTRLPSPNGQRIRAIHGLVRSLAMFSCLLNKPLVWVILAHSHMNAPLTQPRRRARREVTVGFIPVVGAEVCDEVLHVPIAKFGEEWVESIKPSCIVPSAALQTDVRSRKERR